MDLVLSDTELSMLQARGRRTTSEAKSNKNLLLIHSDNIIKHRFGFQYLRTTIGVGKGYKRHEITMLAMFTAAMCTVLTVGIVPI